MPENGQLPPRPDVLHRWMTMHNIRINIHAQPAAMSWDELGEQGQMVTNRITSEEAFFYTVRTNDYGAALLKGHSFPSPTEAYNAAWAALLLYAVEHQEEIHRVVGLSSSNHTGGFPRDRISEALNLGGWLREGYVVSTSNPERPSIENLRAADIAMLAERLRRA